MPATQFNPSTDLTAADLERIRPHLGCFLDDGFELKTGHARLFDGQSHSVGEIRAFSSFCVIEFRPTSGRPQQRTETFVFGNDGHLMTSFATEWGATQKDGLKGSGLIMASAPYARTGLEIVRKIIEHPVAR